MSHRNKLIILSCFYILCGSVLYFTSNFDPLLICFVHFGHPASLDVDPVLDGPVFERNSVGLGHVCLRLLALLLYFFKNETLISV